MYVSKIVFVFFVCIDEVFSLWVLSQILQNINKPYLTLQCFIIVVYIIEPSEHMIAINQHLSNYYKGWQIPFSRGITLLTVLSTQCHRLWTRVMIFFYFSSLSAYSVFFITGLLLSMQIPFVGFQPIRTSEHMAAAGTFCIQ